MGTLTLPSTGVVYMDANSLIYSVETQPPYWPLLYPLWQHAQAGHVTLATSTLSLLETLVEPLRRGDTTLVNAYENLFHTSEVDMIPLIPAVLREAARLRALLPSLRTPDAIHAASALLEGCILFVTNDPKFRQVPHLPVVVLKDILASP